MFLAKIVADSVSEAGIRITTFQLRYPRFIHAEFMTHRVFSRNASSSRAIPVKKLLETVAQIPAAPIHWGANQSGMQANTELPAWKKDMAKLLWKGASYAACGFAWALDKLGAHKQIVNRILEPFCFIDVIVTATDFNNYFGLRYHKDAQPEIKELAKLMYQAYAESVPVKLAYGEWHLPYITDQEKLDYSLEDQIKMSVARCARVSYLNHDQTLPDITKDVKLYDRLVVFEPLHASPAEHQASPDEWIDTVTWSTQDGLNGFWKNVALHGNFKGWIQYRKTLPNECIKEFVLGA